MVNQAEEPLTKVTLNLYSSDVEYLRERLKGTDWKWTEAVRQIVRDKVVEDKTDQGIEKGTGYG